MRCSVSRVFFQSLCRATWLAGAALIAGTAAAAVETDPVTELLDTPGSFGSGFVLRGTASPYRDVKAYTDLLPLYLYEGERVFLRSGRAGLKLAGNSDQRFEVFVEKRLDGFPIKGMPASLAGMAPRTSATDAGLDFRKRLGGGVLQAQALHDISSGHGGNEFRLGYSFEGRSGAWTWRPSVTLALRDATLNDYYYGVRPSEATPGRPAYSAGAGLNTTLALDGRYAISRGWRLLAGVSATVLSGEITDSPIVNRRVLPSLYVGAAYDFGAPTRPLAVTSSPTYIKALYGKSSDDGCHLARILSARCFATESTNYTTIAGIQIGKPLIDRFNGWPVEIVGYAGLTRHDDRGLQPNGLQADLFLKIYFSGFPWSDRVKTRAGWGFGMSLAQRPPYIEASSLAATNEPSSRLLNYLDPSLDVSLGDVIGVRSLKDTYVGVGVSHRSGVFKSSRLYGNVNGGSNYIYTYVETAF